MKVVLFYRKYIEDQFSIESVFDSLLPHLAEEVEIEKKTMPFPSKGIFNRLGNILYAFFNQGDVNHITGDIHYIALLLKKDKTILTIHDIFPLYQFKGYKRKLFKKLWFDFPIRKSRLITTISSFTRKELIELGNYETPIVVIPNPLSLSLRFKPKKFNAETPVILQIGTKQNKNILRLAEALASFSCELRVIGKLSKDQKGALSQAKIKFREYRSLSSTEVIKAYEECDIVCFVSTYEGFGLPIIEGQAMGRAVLSSDTCSMPEVSGKGALLVDPLSVHSIERGLRTLIENDSLREDLIQKGLENAERFLPEKIAKDYLALYQEIN